MKQVIDQSQFMDAFEKMDRKENFSYDGLSALYDYFEEYEDSTGEEIELDVIAICCEYSEYDNLEELCKQYESVRELRNDDVEYDEIIDKLRESTTVIETSGDSVVIQDF